MHAYYGPLTFKDGLFNNSNSNERKFVPRVLTFLSPGAQRRREPWRARLTMNVNIKLDRQKFASNTFYLPFNIKKAGWSKAKINVLHKGEGLDNLNLASLHSFAPAFPRLNDEMRYQERYYQFWERHERYTVAYWDPQRWPWEQPDKKNLENMSYKHNQLFYYAIVEMGGINKFWKDLTGVTRERLEGKLFSFTQ